MRRFLVLLLALAACDEPPRRYEVEVLYTIHRNLTAENYERLDALFRKAFPGVNVARLEPTPSDRQAHYSLYRDRLLEQAGTSYEKLREALEKEGTGEEDPEPILVERGFALVAAHVDRELRLRGMLLRFLDEAKRLGSVKALFDHLRRHDDAERPLCALEPGTGLVVYRHVTGTGQELEDLEDSGVRFTRNFRVRVAQLRVETPAFSQFADTLGPMGDGRHVLRLLAVHGLRRASSATSRGTTAPRPRRPRTARAARATAS